MIDLVRRVIESIVKKEGRAIGLDRWELELMPDSVSKELAIMMGINFEEERRREKPQLILAVIRS